MPQGKVEARQDRGEAEERQREGLGWPQPTPKARVSSKWCRRISEDFPSSAHTPAHREEWGNLATVLKGPQGSGKEETGD